MPHNPSLFFGNCPQLLGFKPNIFYNGTHNPLCTRAAIAEPEVDALGHCKAFGDGRRRKIPS
jgi:hypothetical protein